MGKIVRETTLCTDSRGIAPDTHNKQTKDDNTTELINISTVLLITKNFFFFKLNIP